MLLDLYWGLARPLGNLLLLLFWGPAGPPCSFLHASKVGCFAEASEQTSPAGQPSSNPLLVILVVILVILVVSAGQPSSNPFLNG